MGAPAQTTTQGYRHAQNALLYPCVVKLFEQNYCKSKKSVTILTYYEKLCPTLYQKAPKALVHFDWCTFLFLILHKKRFVSHGYEHAGIRQCVLCMSIPLRVRLAKAPMRCKLFLCKILEKKNHQQKPTPDDTPHS